LDIELIIPVRVFLILMIFEVEHLEVPEVEFVVAIVVVVVLQAELKKIQLGFPYCFD